ncbi:hypothetical protein COCSADRAFT_186815 [Bipolaris sorokiniana ND90Pr]|uniref:Uncharacterized protein n=1 Tax=Cochliobolus sativus (strain ND90Pr / ATCC 201652) TaxID=665912 RepID=M2TLN6_COCSN|nr:uncharacterized protein COCSADRAFT_186815 [Bipolaris sorokiniana ND90Pr]EMD70071.1 hypothetical protein COCSADRAFT_186815 [Bipolaris sorokiniana ND90Pr]
MLLPPPVKLLGPLQRPTAPFLPYAGPVPDLDSPMFRRSTLPSPLYRLQACQSILSAGLAAALPITCPRRPDGLVFFHVHRDPNHRQVTALSPSATRPDAPSATMACPLLLRGLAFDARTRANHRVPASSLTSAYQSNR